MSSVSYDVLGRQTQVVALDSSTAQAGVTRTFGYDRRNLLKQIDQTYQNPALSPSTSVKRTYDGYGALLTEQTYIAGLLKDTWQQTRDSAGRRILLTELNNPALPFTYKYQADGNLIEADFNNGAYYYEYKIDGRLYSRNTPLHAQGLSRDWSGRIVEASEYVGATLVLNEKIAWRADSTQSANAITRIGGSSWSESRSYNYDLRGRLISESFAARVGVTGSAGYQFDGGAPGGIGVRTGVTLAGNLSGIQTGTYNAFAQLSGLSASGNLSGALANPLTQTFDSAGNAITRLRAGGNDALSWDALGRLVGLVRRNGSNSGLNWSAVYDGLGRRLQTTQQTVTGGALSGSALTLKSAFDPEVEFLEVSVTLGTTRNWLVHGPDLNGVYGGLQGTGGLEAVYNASTGLTTGIVSDNSGHVAATFTSNGLFTWNPVASTGYGTAPGSVPAPPLDASRDFASILGWRGHYLDCTGFYAMGMRYYDPESGTFLSADPMGHPASLSLYDYCASDPINRVDPDGRVAKVASQSVRVTGEDADQLTQSMVEGIGILKVVVVDSPWQYTIYAGVFSSDNDPKNNGQTNAATGKLMGKNELGVALPDRSARGKIVQLINPTNGISVTVPVIDVGPHYIDDPYATQNLRPRAETRGNLYLQNPIENKIYKRDRNRAGIDLSPATMKALGIPVGIVNTSEGPEWQTTGKDPTLNWRYIK